MVTLPISKDISLYEPKVLFGLTARTAAFTGAALGVGLAIGLAEWFLLGLDPTEGAQAMVIPACTIGIWAMGYVRPLGLLPEVWLSLWIRHRLMPQHLVYRSSASLGRAPMPRAGMARETYVRKKEGRGPQGVAKPYARLRGQRGIELWEPGD